MRAHADDGAPIDIGGVRLRMLLARLALDAGRAVSAETLVSDLWGAEPPADSANALQSLVSRLRKALRGHGTLDSVAGGYQLALDAERIDAHRFETLAARGRRDLAAGRDAAAAGTLGEALGLWRGDALADVRDAPFAAAPAARLEDLRAGVAEDRFEAELRLGRHAEVLADLEASGAEQPLRERLAGLRMRALAAAGRQSEALAVYERIRATLAGELGVDPSAELQEIHLAVLRGELTGPARAERAAEHLPVRLTSFVGRDDELKLLAELMSGSRLVTLVGPGGAGKTRLAVETAARHRAHERGRVWFVPLAGVRDAGDVPSAVLGALGSRGDLRMGEKPVPRQPVEALERIAELLGPGESVLVLDNCEHVVEAAAALAHELLGRVPELRLLATSREPLAITGEALCPLGPLEVPTGKPDVAAATGTSAVRLFVDRATAVQPRFVLDESCVDSVVDICRRLDGMPLALELAAARLRSMSAPQIVQRLDDRFRLLTSGSRSALPRQRTLRAVVEWSWDLLDDAESVLARRLAVFPSGASLSAIEAICADELLPAEDVLYVLGSLVEKSIVDAQSSPDPRYRMLETIRAFADERLAEAGEEAAVTGRFGAYFLDLAEENEPLLRTGEQLRAMAVFDAEHDNMLSALRRAIDTEDADTAYRLTGALFWYWAVRGFDEQPLLFVDEILRFGDRIPAHAHAAFAAVRGLTTNFPGTLERNRLRPLIDECVRTGACDHYSVLAIGLPMLAFMVRDQELAARELARAHDHADPWARACAYWVDGLLHADRGDLAGAQRARAESLRRFEELGDRWGLAITLAMLAEGQSLEGDHVSAIAAYERGLALSAELGARDDVSQHLVHVAIQRMRAGDLDGAARDVRAAERLLADGGTAEMEAVVTFGLIELARLAGDFAKARRYLARLETIAGSAKLPSAVAREWIATARASLLLSEGDLAGARAELPTAIRVASERRDMPDTAVPVENAARLFRLEGDFLAAARTLGMSESIRGAFDRGNPELRELIGELIAELGEPAYRAAYREGASMSKEDAVAAVLVRLS
nr:BTAD domain-containing putative transcriptional regulator [Amycolatopsis anabasis]